MWSSMCVRFASILCRTVESRSTALSIRRVSAMPNKTREIERSIVQKERKIKVNGTEINYARVGSGDHPVLLLPGALGTIWTDFKPQIENLNADKLTIVAWDPPGYGKSRPPDRTFPDDFYQRDATMAHNLMQILGYSKFSLIGWSSGGITSLLLASSYPENIYKMVVFGATAYIHPDEMKIYENLRDINNWSERIRRSYIEIYGEDCFKKTWSGWVDTIRRLYEKQNGNLCKQVLSKIKCPTLIIHGAKDPMVLPEHPEYLKQNIASSNVRVFEKGGHNLHLKYFEDFNKLVTDFLLD